MYGFIKISSHFSFLIQTKLFTLYNFPCHHLFPTPHPLLIHIIKQPFISQIVAFACLYSPFDKNPRPSRRNPDVHRSYILEFTESMLSYQFSSCFAMESLCYGDFDVWVLRSSESFVASLHAILPKKPFPRPQEEDILPAITADNASMGALANHFKTPPVT